MQVNFAPGQTSAELVIREVGNENPYKLPAKEPLNLQVDGVITCIYAFLEKRWGIEQIDKEHTHILVNREKLVVTLVTNENDERTTQTIIGSIQLSRQFAGFHINDGQLWKPVQLGDFSDSTVLSSRRRRRTWNSSISSSASRRRFRQQSRRNTATMVP